MINAVDLVDDGLYQSQPFGDLYPTTATSDDYAFSRHVANPAAGKTYGFTFEYGGGDFFPPYAQMPVTIAETDAGMLEFAAAVVLDRSRNFPHGTFRPISNSPQHHPVSYIKKIILLCRKGTLCPKAHRR